MIMEEARYADALSGLKESGGIELRLTLRNFRKSGRISLDARSRH